MELSSRGREAVAGRWEAGALGELIVGRHLETLPAGWFLTHDVLLGGKAGNLDHVLVGPPGVFVVNTKNHGDRAVIIKGTSVWVDGKTQDHAVQGGREARTVSRRLSAATGLDVTAASLIVMLTGMPWSVDVGATGQVCVVLAQQAALFLERLRPQASECQVRQLTGAVRLRSTWV